MYVLVCLCVVLMQLPGKLNEFDGKGYLPLDLALHSRQESISKTLMKHHVNVNMADQTGCSLLHMAIKNGQYGLWTICEQTFADVQHIFSPFCF